MSNCEDLENGLDAETFSVLVTMGIDAGLALLIFLGFLLYRRFRGDNLRERQTIAE